MRDASNTTLDNRWKEHDVAQLVLPAEVFSSQMVGFAHTGALCNDHMSVGVIADQSDSKSAATTGRFILIATFLNGTKIILVLVCTMHSSILQFFVSLFVLFCFICLSFFCFI